jgi:polar amino acid transport system substrate-binding protein
MRRILLLAILLIATSMPQGALGQPAISAEIAPLGKLRFGTNGGNQVLVIRTADGKISGGLAVDVGKFIAEKLGISFELVAYANADAYTQSFGKGEWDVGFGPPTPAAAEKADFIVDLVLADYMFVAAPGREFADASQVDRPGVKIAVGTNSVSDHFLSRTLKSAELVRVPGGVGPGLEVLRIGKADVWAASTSNVYAIPEGLPGAKVIPGVLTSERYTLALPKGRSSAAQGRLAAIANEAKRTGVLLKAVEQPGLRGVRVAPD